jgi:hypothetical protein
MTTAPILNIEARKSGLKIVANPFTVAEANEASLLTARLAFPLRLVHETLVEGVTDPIVEPKVQIFVPREEDCGLVGFQQLPLGVAKPVASIDFRKLPQWLIDAMKRAHPRESWTTAAEDYRVGGESELAWMRLTNSYRFLDHEGFIEDERGIVLVSEPYGLTQEKLDSLNLFLTDTGLKVNICGTSNYFPSRTIRIEIWSA